MDITKSDSYKYLLSLLKKTDYHSNDLINRLVKRNFKESEINLTIRYFKDLGVINDQRYLENRIYKLMISGYSKNFIEQKFLTKGLCINSELIDIVFNQNDYTEITQIHQLKQDFIRKKGNPRSNIDNFKLMRHLQSRGHSLEFFEDA